MLANAIKHKQMQTNASTGFDLALFTTSLFEKDEILTLNLANHRARQTCSRNRV